MSNAITTYAKHHKYIVGGLAILVIAATAVGSRLGGSKSTSTGEQLTKVSTVSAAKYLRDRGIIAANGTVESLQQAELRSQASGPVARIYVQIGSRVSAGQALVALQSSDIAAQLAQAQALLKGAQARLDELKKGVRTEQIALLETKLASAKQTLADTKSQQDTAVQSAYTSLLNTGLAAIGSPANTSTDNPAITGSYTGTDTGEYKISIYAAGDGIRFQYNGLENGGSLVATTPIKLGSKGLFIQFSSQNPGVNNTWTISLPNTQAAGYNAANSAYQNAKQARQTAINGATTAVTAAEQELKLALAGATNEQIKGQEAAVDQARASVAAIAAQLDKTVIKSPINGSVASLPVKYGELVSPGSLVASVVNKGGLQVKAYISDFDLPYVKEGAVVSINENATGTLARMSPSINPQTKNVEIQVLVVQPEQSGLVVGQNAALKIVAAQSQTGSPVFLLPLQAVKIGQNNASVFTVNSDATLAEHKVTTGSVSGEFVEVTDGLTAEMELVTAVYELKDGQKVSAEKQQ